MIVCINLLLVALLKSANKMSKLCALNMSFAASFFEENEGHSYW